MAKIQCSHPGCDFTKDVPWYNAIPIRLQNLYLCKEHRFESEEEWNRLESEFFGEFPKSLGEVNHESKR